MEEKINDNKFKLLILNWIPPTIVCLVVLILEFFIPSLIFGADFNAATSSPMFTNSIPLIFIVGIVLGIIITIFYDFIPGGTLKRKKWMIFLIYLLLFYILFALSLFNNYSIIDSFALSLITSIMMMSIPSAFWSHIFITTRRKLGGGDNVDIRNIGDYGVEGVATKVNKDEVLRKAYMIPWRSLKVIRFRIEKIDEQGNVIKIIPIEIRGKDFIGEISEGDKVKVKGKMINGTVLAREIVNLTTNAKLESQIIVKGETLPIVIKWIVMLIILIIIGFIIRSFMMPLSL